MSDSKSKPRRTKIERGIYRSSSGQLEVFGSDGKSRFEVQSSPNITAARKRRATLIAKLVSEGESVDEVAWTLGHKDGRTTRAVYVHELRSAEQRSRRLARAERNVKWMASGEGSEGESSQSTESESIAYLSDKRSAAE